MSLNGPSAPYYTPPPKKKTSPWVWVGVGCLVITLLFIGVVVAGSMFAINKINAEMNKPLSEQEVLASIGDVPLYPGAKVDIQMSKAVRGAMGFAGSFSGGKVKFNSAAFRVDASTDKVAEWYDKKLPDAGWKQVVNVQSVPGASAANATQRQYLKGTQQLVVQTRSGVATKSKTNDTRNVLILTTVSGMPAR